MKILTFQNMSLNGTSLETPSERSFGIISGLCFILIAGYRGFHAGIGDYLTLVFAGQGVVCLALGLIAPKYLIIPNRLWYKLGLILHSIVNPFVLFVIFFFCITPTALCLRIFGKDILFLKFEKGRKSYWVKKESLDPASMKMQF